MEEGKVASSPPTSSEVEEKEGSSEKLRGNLVRVDHHACSQHMELMCMHHT